MNNTQKVATIEAEFNIPNANLSELELEVQEIIAKATDNRAKIKELEEVFDGIDEEFMTDLELTIKRIAIPHLMSYANQAKFDAGG